MLVLSAIFLAAAVIAVPLFKRLGLGSVLGYLAAGAMIGPSGLGLVNAVEETLHVAELGVVLLLFIIGLELQPTRLWRMRGTVFGLGSAQLVLTGLALAGIALALGLDWRIALVVSVALTMSSTAFATQVLGERNEMGAPHGRAAFGILLFQDLTAIPFLALLPLLGRETDTQHTHSVAQGVLMFVVVVGVVLAGRFLLQPVFRFVAQARSHELSTATALLVVIGTALIMQAVGLSMALGAFMAGVVLADSEYRHELEANIEPFKGLLLGLFFMAVGMSANLHILVDTPWMILSIAFGLVVIKGLVLMIVARMFRLNMASSTNLAVAICQGGEFAFVIFGAAHEARLLSSLLIEQLVVAVTLSMVMTPFLWLARDYVAKRLSEKRSAPEFDTIEPEESRVIIAGFGRFGQMVARILRVKRIAFTALDASPTHVDFVRKFGNKVYYGDASRIELLRAAKAETAEVFVLAIDDIEASMRTLKVVQEHYPRLRIVARARNRQHAYALLDAGAETVIRETFLSSLDAARITLLELGVSANDARSITRKFAEYDEAMVRETFTKRNDEKALIESAKRYSEELERIFEEDARVPR